jgi:hypothetical protein
MGNNHSHDGLRRNSLGRTNSGAENNDRSPTQLIPIDKLSKVKIGSSDDPYSLVPFVVIYKTK